MEIINATEFPNDIIFEREGPCISLYQPTHRHRPENKQDLIRFKNLCQEIENTLLEDKSKEYVDNFMKPLWDLEQDRIFWNGVKDGLAILMNEKKMVIYKLSRPVKELAVVSKSFHIKPLIRVFQSSDTYYVLGLNRQTFKLFVGNRYELKEVVFDEDTPVEIEDVLGDQYTESHLSHGSSSAGSGVIHGHGGKKDEINKDIERYFRYVDRLVLEEYSKPTEAPLVLAALNEYHGQFRNISHNDYLLSDGIYSDFESLDLESLREKSWEIVENIYLDRTKKLVERFNNERAQFRGTDDLVEAAKMAAEHRIDTILIESDRIIKGAINRETGEIKWDNLEDPESDDVLDALAELVMQSNGEVVLLPKERMPSTTGIAATFRY